MILINRDLLLRAIEESRKKNPHKDSKISANHIIEHDHIAHLVLEQPTAYEVNKVIEQVMQDCFAMGFDESQTEIIVDDIRQQEIKKPDRQQT